MDTLFKIILIGVGATLFMDIWALLQKRLFNIPSLDYRLVGRWLGHIPKGKYFHNTIIQAQPVKGEVLIGWFIHYLIGIIFSALLIMINGPDWLSHPDFLSALILGILTVAAPFLLMQPAFGFGIAASKTPQPNVARRRSMISHSSFGIGLYISALLLNLS